MAWIASALRRLRDERISALTVAGLILVSAFVAASAPRLLDRVANDTLRSTILAATPANRNIQLLREDRLAPFANDPFGGVEATAEQVQALLPGPVAALVTERAWTVETGRWRILGLPGDPATIRLRIQVDAAERIHLVDGRWPAGTTRAVTDPSFDASSTDAPPPSITAFEVALSSRAAADLKVAVGDQLSLATDASDPLVGRGHVWSIVAEVVGTFTVDDAADSWWLGNTELARPSIRSPGGDLRITDATALMSPDAYGAYMADTAPLFLPVRYTFRHYVDPTRLDANDVNALGAELRRLEAALPSTNVTFNQATGLRTGLRAILDGYQARWASAAAILTVGAIGPAAVAAGALGLVAVLAAQRRRSALALSRGRGASLTQVTAAVVAEGLVLAGPVAVLAVGAARALTPAGPEAASMVAGGAVAAVAMVLLVLATVPATSGPAFGPARTASVPGRPTPRRLLFEGLVVALAAGGALLLRERGIRGASSAGELGQADPLVAAVPALIGVAAGLIAVRLFPYPMRMLAWLASRRRDLVPLLAMRRATQGTRTAPVLLVLLATAAIGAFSSAVLVHLDRAAEAVGWREVGAAYRIDSTSGSLRSGFDPRTLPDVEAAAVAYRVFAVVGPRNLRVELTALAIADYDAVVAGTPADPGFPPDLFAARPDVIPLIVSRSVSERPDGLALGAEFPVTLEGYTFPARVVAIRDDLPALASTPQFAILSRDQVRASFPAAPMLPTTVFLRAPAGSGEAIRSAVTIQIPVGAVTTSRAEETAAIRTSPTSRAVVAGISAAALVAMGYAILAVAAALALSGASRAVEVAHLRTLGLTGRQAAGLVVLEHGPTVLVAFAAGVALGLGTFLALRQGLGLEALVGSQVEVAITVEAAQLGLILGGIVTVIVFGLVLGTLMQRGAAPVAAVRRGFE